MTSNGPKEYTLTLFARRGDRIDAMDLTWFPDTCLKIACGELRAMRHVVDVVALSLVDHADGRETVWAMSAMAAREELPR